MAEGSGPSSLHEQVFQKWMARGRVPGRPTARGRSLFFGKALWPALETALDGVEEGRSQCVEEAEAGKGSPQLQPFFPVLLPQLMELQEVYKEEVRGGSRSQDTVTVPALDRPQGCSRPQALPSTKEGEA